MSILNKILKRSGEGANILTFLGVKKNKTTEMSLSTVYRCVKVISESVAMLPINLYEVNGEAARRLTAADNQLAAVLSSAPDSRMTRFTFLTDRKSVV